VSGLTTKKGRPGANQRVESVLIRRAARRLGVQAAAFVAVAVVLVTSAAVMVLLRDQERAVTDLLDATIALADDVEDPPLDMWLVIRGAGGQDTTRGLPPRADDPAAFAAVVAGGPPTVSERRAGGVGYRVMTERRADGVVVQAVLDLSARQADRRRILTAMLIAGAGGLVLAAAAGTWLSRRALQPLSAALALQRRFVADAGHELRTPLTLLGTRAQLLRRRLQQVRAGEWPRSWPDGARTAPTVADRALAELDGVVADSTHLTAILEDLLLAADPRTARPQGTVDLTGLCRDAVRTASAVAQQRGLTLHGPAPTDAPVEVVGAAVALQRALTALVDNALRHARSEVSVTVRRSRERAVAAVADDGPGVDPLLRPRLFDRFAVGATDPEKGRRRYGLGLALVAEIAAAHRGEVSVSGPPGTTLRIDLPAAPRSFQESSERQTRRSPA
jgi:signal transduction histidine kinase